MGHENNMKCAVCGSKLRQTGQSKNKRIVYFACLCGKTKYSRSAGL